MSAINIDDIIALKDSPKAHQVLNHLSVLGVKDAIIDIRVNAERSWAILRIDVPRLRVAANPPDTYLSPVFITDISFFEDQIAFIHGTFVSEEYQGKGLFSLIDGLRERILEKLCVKFAVSLVRNDNTNMIKAALKVGWKRSFTGPTHSLFVKEVFTNGNS
jgi:hypothetical protein